MSHSPSGPVIVCGMGNVGFRLVRLLCRLGEDVVVVTREAREDWRRIAEAEGARFRLGDARDEARLSEAGIATARALVVATSHDPSNIEIALDAKRLRSDIPLVVRLFDQQLARSFESAFGIRRAASVSALAAPAFAAAALGERSIGSFEVDGEGFVVGRASEATDPERLAARGLAILDPDGERCPMAVGRRSDWEGAPRREGAAPGAAPAGFRRMAQGARGWLSGARHVWCNAPTPLRSAFLALLVLFAVSAGVFRVALDLTLVDAVYFIVTTVTTVGYGDITPRAASGAVKLYASVLMIMGSAGTAMLYSMVTDYLVTARFRQLMGRAKTPEQGHVIVAGLGNVGFRVAESLVTAGDSVVVIERDSGAEFVESIRNRASLVVGDARLVETLNRAGAAGAAAVVSLVDDDAINLAVVLAARRLNPRARLVARIFDADFARKVQESLGVDAALSTSLVAAPTFAAAALYPGVLAAFVAGNRLLVLSRRPVPADWEGRTPSELRANLGLLLLFHRLAGKPSWQPLRADRPFPAEGTVVSAISRDLRQRG